VNAAGAETLYLDHNSTTPLLPAVWEAMRPLGMELFANPASAHRPGQRARQALETARETIAALLDAEPAEVIFTSGATEANNLAIFGLAGQPPGRVISSLIEHPSVAESVAQLQKRGFTVATLKVNTAGIVVSASLPPLLDTNPRLLTVMLANNETGAIQPILELRRLQVETHWFFHCDAVQAVGKIPVQFHQLGVTSLSLSAHKFNGPRGIGALLVRKGATLQPHLYGGHQQQARRPGTEPVVLAVGMAKALEIAHAEMNARNAKLHQLRLRFLEQLQAQAAPVVLNGPEASGLPNTLNLSFPGCDAAALLMKLDLAGVACSTGSACSSGSLLPSPVLQAMGCPPEVLHSAMRFSLSHLHTEEEMDWAAKRIIQAVRQLRSSN
jgi:cysteine desulfurase